MVITNLFIIFYWHWYLCTLKLFLLWSIFRYCIRLLQFAAHLKNNLIIFFVLLFLSHLKAFLYVLQSYQVYFAFQKLYSSAVLLIAEHSAIHVCQHIYYCMSYYYTSIYYVHTYVHLYIYNYYTSMYMLSDHVLAFAKEFSSICFLTNACLFCSCKVFFCRSSSLFAHATTIFHLSSTWH